MTIGKEKMKSKKIEKNEYEALTVSSLPSNPTAKVGYGGLGFSATQMKAAFDALPIFIIDRLNMLIADICEAPTKSVSTQIKTGIGGEAHTLFNLFTDIESGRFASYLFVGEGTLANEIADIKERIRALEEGRR